MRVVSCQAGGKIAVPGVPATIEVIAVQGKTARLAVRAPADVAVHREETRRPTDRDHVERPA